MLVAALEQEESKYCQQSHQEILSLLNHFQRTRFCRHFPVSQRRVWEVNQCVFAYVMGTEVLSRGTYSEEQKHFLCWTLCITAAHNKLILTTSIVWLFSWISIFKGSMICSVSKCVGSREKSQGRKYAYLGFIFRKPCRTCYATGIPTALENVQCRQVITCMVCDI